VGAGPAELQKPTASMQSYLVKKIKFGPWGERSVYLQAGVRIVTTVASKTHAHLEGV
jgi:hypothetical protein